MAPALQHPAIPVRVPPLPPNHHCLLLTSLSFRQRSESSPRILFIILLNALAVTPCQNSHLYSIHGPSATPGGDTQCSPTAQCSPACSLASALRSSLSLHTSLPRTSLEKGSIRLLKTNTTKFTCHRCGKLPGLSPQGCADL